MKNVKKLLALIIITFTLLLSGCSKNLEAPSNLKIDRQSNKLSWDNVEDASEYIVSINDKLYQSNTNSFSLDRLLSGEYVIKVKSVDKNSESSWSEDINVSYSASDLLTFKKIDGYNEYEIIGLGKYKDSHLIIPDTYNNMPVTKVAAEAFMGYNSIDEITLGKNIRVIEKNAFKDIPSLKRLNLNEGLEIISDNAFQGDMLLMEVILPDSVTKIGEGAFSFCKSIETLVLPMGLKEIKRKTFSDLTSLRSLKIPNSVEVIGDYAFSRLLKLEHLTLSKNLKKIGASAFYESKALNEVAIPGGVKEISEFAFSRSGIKKLTISEGVEVIAKQAFYECERLEGIALPKTLREIKSFAFDETKLVKEANDFVYVDNWLIKANTLDLKEMEILPGTVGIAGSAIRDNNYLKKVVLPSSLKYIGEYNFYKMKKLSSLNLGDTSVEEISEGSIYECLALDIMKLPNTLKRVGRFVFQETIVTTLATDYIVVDSWLIGHKNKMIDEIVIDSNIRGISEYAFSNFIKVKRINFTNAANIRYINEGAFNALREVIRLDLPDSILEIGEYAFANSSKLDYLKLPKNLKVIEKSTFNGAGKLRIVILPETLEEIRDYAFYEASIKRIEMPSTLKYIGKGAFYSNPDLEYVSFNEGLEVIDSYAFSKAISLIDIKLPNSLVEIKDHAFFGAKSLEAIDFGGTRMIGDYAFYDSISLKNIDLNKVLEVGDYAFTNNNQIEDLILTGSIEKIGKHAFTGFSKLRGVIIGNNVKEISDYAFELNSTLTFYLEGKIQEKEYSQGWNSKFRPVVENCVLSEDRSYVVSFKIDNGIYNLNSFNNIIYPYRSGYKVVGFKDSNGNIYDIDSIKDIKNTTLEILYEVIS